MRLGPHLTGPGPRDELRQGVRGLFAEYMEAVRPPMVKSQGEGYSPDLGDYCASLGSELVLRPVLNEGELAADGNAAIGKVLEHGRQNKGHFTYLQFGNEEMQGKDHVEPWDRLCRLMSNAMRECERHGFQAAIIGASVGQPELAIGGKGPRWERPDSVAMLKRARDGGHVVALNEYYGDAPWQTVEEWDNPIKARGWHMLRCRRHVEVWHGLGIHGVQFFISESGQDAVPGTTGTGGWRVSGREPYAPRMHGYGLRLGYVPGARGWVDFGFAAPNREYRHGEKDWRNYALDYDVVELRRMIAHMRLLPRGGVPVANTAAIFAEAEALCRAKDKHDEEGIGLRVNLVSGFNKWNHQHGYWPRINEQAFASLDGRMGQAVQSPVTGEKLVLEWNGAVVVHRLGGH